jgi:hypothetical protein
MSTVAKFIVPLAVSDTLSDAARQHVAEAIRAAVEHWRDEVGLTDGDSPAIVTDVLPVEPA